MKNKIKIYMGVSLPIIILLINFTFASGPETSISGYTQLLELSGNILYIILRPMLAITGLVIGNNMVTGNVFGITETLFKFWLLVRNFAFLTLVAIIFYDIIRGVIANKVIEVGKNFLKYILAGILIPLSWYLVVLLVSISNLLIISVGELPLNFRNNIEKEKDAKVLSVHTQLNLADKLQTSDFFRFAAYYSNGTENYITCPFKNPNQKPKEGLPGDGAYYDAIYQSDMDVEASRILRNFGVKIDTSHCAINQRNLLAIGNYDSDCAIIDNPSNGNAITSQSCFKISEKDVKGNYAMNKNYYDALNAGQGKIRSDNAVFLADINDSKVGPLYTIYASLMNFSTISASNVGTASDVQLIEFGLKLFVSVLAIIPLAGIAILCVVRVGVIWIIMVFSPFIVLINCLKTRASKDENDVIGKSEGFWGKGRIATMTRDLGEIIKLIFQPVILIFGLSLGLIFLQTINYKLGDNSLPIGRVMGMEITKLGNERVQYASPATVINIKLPTDTFGDSILFNLFQRLIMNIFGIMIMWQIWMMGMKFSKITEKLGGDIQKLSGDILDKTRIIPLPLGENGSMKLFSGQSLKAGFVGGKEVISDYYKEKFKDKSYDETIKPKLDNLKVNLSEDRGKANNNIYNEANNATQATDFSKKTSSERATQFANIYSDSAFAKDNNDKIKAGNYSQSSGLNNAAKKFGFNSFEAATRDAAFAQALFDNKGTESINQFGDYKQSAMLYSNNIIQSMKVNRDVTNNVAPQPGVQRFFKQVTPDSINIIGYLGYIDKKHSFSPEPAYILSSRKAILEGRANIDNINDFIAKNSKEKLMKIYEPEGKYNTEQVISGTNISFIPNDEIKTTDSDVTNIYKRNNGTNKYIKVGITEIPIPSNSAPTNSPTAPVAPTVTETTPITPPTVIAPPTT